MFSSARCMMGYILRLETVCLFSTPHNVLWEIILTARSDTTTEFPVESTEPGALSGFWQCGSESGYF